MFIHCLLFKTNNALTFGNAPEAGFLALVTFAKDLKAEEGFIRVFQCKWWFEEQFDLQQGGMRWDRFTKVTRCQFGPF